MITSPHQRIITVKRDMPKQSKENKRPYMIAYTDVIEEAARNLSTVGEFKVYLYMINNQDNYKFGCSPQNIADRYGLNIDTVKKAINKLIEKGYIIKTKGTYEFHEKPLVLDLEPIEEIRKKFSSKGQILELTYAELVELVGEERAKFAWDSAK